MRLAALVSGGKDSLYAAYLSVKYAQEGNELKYIISIISENPESYMFHVPNVGLVVKQAEVMGIPLIQRHTAGEKEKELDDLKDVLQAMRYKIDGVVSGAVQSNYQKTRIDKICEEINLASVAPLWQRDPEKLLRQMVADKFEIIITAVGAPPLNRRWLGKKIDEKCISKLAELHSQYRISMLGEGGEFETFVLNCPLFKKRLKVIKSEKQWERKTKSGVLKLEIE